jgi:hypothetical protein
VTDIRSRHVSNQPINDVRPGYHYTVEDRGYVTPCWPWALSLLSNGYGRLTRAGTTVMAHRWVYERLRGPIPDGLTLDHLCQVQECVNPDHLEPVTIRENILRGSGTSAHHARKTHCLRGHGFTPENTAHDGRGRICLECQRIRGRAAYVPTVKTPRACAHCGATFTPARKDATCCSAVRRRQVRYAKERAR